MTDMTMQRDAVTTTDRAINQIGSKMLFAEPVVAIGLEAGISDALVFYAGGRGGVLGSTSWEQIQSAFGFFPADIVRSTWNQVLEWGNPPEMASHYANGLSEAGRASIEADAAATIAELGAIVNQSVTPMGFALFSGWRAMPRPGDPSGDAALEIMTLRELRGDIHLQDLAAAEIQPVEAEIVVRGTDGMWLHGWQPPYPDPASHRDAVAAATETTSARMHRIYDEALSDAQWDEFAGAVASLH